MMKARTIFIWEGPETFTITRGFPLQGDSVKSTKIRHKGVLWGSFTPVTNIDEIYVGESKKLCVKDKILPMWNVIKIKLDYLTHEPYIPDVPSHLVSQVKTLRNERNTWKRLYYEERRKNLDRNQEDRFEEKVKAKFKFLGKARQLANPMEGYGMGYPFGYRSYGLGYTPPPPSQDNE